MKALASKPGDLSLIPGVHMIEGKKQLPQFSSAHGLGTGAPTCIHNHPDFARVSAAVMRHREQKQTGGGKG